MKKPNILFLMTDQHRWDSLGCYGNSVVETPNLDWIASEGSVFSNAYTPTPSCNPARAALLTGMDPWNTGMFGTRGQPGSIGVGFAHTMPGELAKAGYHTQGIGSLGFSPGRALNGFHHLVTYHGGKDSDYYEWFEKNKTGDYSPTDHGMGPNSWVARPYHAPEFLHPTNWTINESIRFLKKRDPSKPFFLKTSFIYPHSPYNPLPYYFDHYLNKTLPKQVVGEWASMHDKPKDAANTSAWRGKRSDEEIGRARAGYYGSITHIDHQIGRLLTELSSMGELDNTMIVFTSDHGDMLGDHHLWRKTYAYEGSAHIPLIIRLPKAMRSGSLQERIDAPVLLQDIMPTMLDAVGIDIPKTVDGKSMLGLIRGNRSGQREYVHGEHGTAYSEEQEMQYLTDGKFKYIWFPRLGTEQLFDLQQDPMECVDLSASEDYAAELLKWRRTLVSILEPRNLGLTNGDELVCQAGKPYILSPKYQERLANSDFDWTKR